jgi:tetratricopeptide (TPR) repeat protein
LIRSHPDIAEAYKRLAGVYLLMGEWEKAIEATQKMLALKPDDIEALKVLASAYKSNEQYQESIDTVHRIIEIKSDADAWYLLSQNYSLMGDTDQALEYALKAVESPPENSDRLDSQDPRNRAR